MKELSQKTKDLIEKYKHLPLGNRCQTPYFNNRRRGMRGGLRGLVGKGMPEEIIEEAQIFALRDKVDINLIDEKALKAFLMSHDLGIDCSGLVYHLLNTELAARGKNKLSKQIHYPTSWWRTCINKLRPAENINVAVLALPENTHEIKIEGVKVSDLIIMLGTGVKKTYNHVLFVTHIETQDAVKVIHYIHSYAWPSDGLSGTGVREGTISITNENLIEGKWIEQEVTGEENYTYRNAKEAKTLSIRRLKDI
jgi:hypothetical protein